ncbi:hypothetical protein NQZ68_029221 [Dissostichus eleginoides]|nr:hypothetical protein NQZ68_029221 [Dissostichus eleginoides]
MPGDRSQVLQAAFLLEPEKGGSQAEGSYFTGVFSLSSGEKSAQLNGHLVLRKGQYFVHIPVGQALGLMQPDTPAARSFVWLKCSWGHAPIRGCSGQKHPHIGQGGPAVSAGNLAEQGSTTKAFLPKMLELNHGHIVTVASSLGLFSTAGVEDYCASKFGAIGFHESLSHEIKASEKEGINMTLVCPYLVDTGMFKGCRIRKEIEPFLPPLKPEFCVKQSMRAILTDQPMICTPRIVYMVNFMKSILPFEAIVCMYRFLGADKCMYPFLAQRKEAMNNNEAKNGI